MSRTGTINHCIQTLLITVTILLLLFFGLRPKSIPADNDAQWLPGERALIFHGTGIVYVEDLEWFHNVNDAGEFTIELQIAVQNINKVGFRPILMINNGSDDDQLTIWQWGSSIIAMNGDDYDYSRKSPRISTGRILNPEEIVDISITSNNLSTRLYINGQLLVDDQTWQILIPPYGKNTHLILGNSVYAKHGWEGTIYSLTIYAKAFSSEGIYQLYNRELPERLTCESCQTEVDFWCTFTGHNGLNIDDQYGLHIPLLIPERMVILKKSFMVMPWQSFRLNRVFVVDVLLNLFGFIPLGVLLYNRIRQSPTISESRVQIIVVLSCFLISFIIELCQVWQPGRNSSFLDLLLNSLGSYLGILFASIYFRYKKDNTTIAT